MAQRNEHILVHLRGPLLGLVGVFVYGVVGYMAFGHGFVESVYRCILVMTTVGFQAEDPFPAGERVFTASVALLGVVVFLGILGVFAIVLAEGRWREGLRRRRMQRRIDGLRDHYIVCAYGRVGRAVAREFEAESVPFVVIDRLEDLEDRMRSDGVNYLLEDPTSEDVLRRAGIERARGLVSAVDSDADNVYIVLTARSMRPDLFIVARASERPAAARLYKAGADRVISPYVSSGRHMALLALRPRAVDYLEIAVRDHELRLEEVLVDDGSPLIGRSVADVASNSTAVLLRRADGEMVTNPAADLHLERGDLIVLLGESSQMQKGDGRDDATE